MASVAAAHDVTSVAAAHDVNGTGPCDAGLRGLRWKAVFAQLRLDVPERLAY
jgi:hypothetical protein